MAAGSRYTLAGVMGWPVAHSRSPLIHNFWIRQHGLQGAYVLLPVQPSNLEQALRALPVLGFAGCNLTIPHKVAAMALVDRVEPQARHIGAINTIVVEADGTLTGCNTDSFGFMQSLVEAAPQWQARTDACLVLGSGGAARAVIVGLLDAGVPQVRLCNRTLANAQALAQSFGSAVQALPWEQRHAAMDSISLLVNTTSLGMQGQDRLDITLSTLPMHAVVADIVYTPLETDLLHQARARGNPCVSGLGMLLHQARAGFQAWFGQPVAVSRGLTDMVADSL